MALSLSGALSRLKEEEKRQYQEQMAQERRRKHLKKQQKEEARRQKHQAKDRLREEAQDLYADLSAWLNAVPEYAKGSYIWRRFDEQDPAQPLPYPCEFSADWLALSPAEQARARLLGRGQHGDYVGRVAVCFGQFCRPCLQLEDIAVRDLDLCFIPRLRAGWTALRIVRMRACKDRPSYVVAQPVMDEDEVRAALRQIRVPLELVDQLRALQYRLWEMDMTGQCPWVEKWLQQHEQRSWVDRVVL